MTAINQSAAAEEVAALVAVEYAREVLRQARDDTGVTCQISRALLTEHARASALAEQVEALRAELRQTRQDAADDARASAVEAGWQAKLGDEYGGY